jgi:hypothetical protein
MVVSRRAAAGSNALIRGAVRVSRPVSTDSDGAADSTSWSTCDAVCAADDDIGAPVRRAVFSDSGESAGARRYAAGDSGRGPDGGIDDAVGVDVAVVTFVTVVADRASAGSVRSACEVIRASGRVSTRSDGVAVFGSCSDGESGRGAAAGLNVSVDAGLLVVAGRVADVSTTL